jgi:Dolichyl-phosphate-mannose-protein mannosyltransferase
MSTTASPAPISPLEKRLVGLLFGGLLLFNLWAVSVGWKNLNLPGCEFRQAQTALSALFIQRDHDFSLAYPTPVLGKPWSVPMEFPLYQWTVVVLSNATGMSLTAAGRTVSAVCFYLALPAFYLLLARLGLNRTQCLIGLGFILTCPLYIFYARAFLIETMALMFGAWYLVALVEALEKRSGRWLALCVVAGTAAGLIKVTTFIVFLIPALACSGRWLWQSRPGTSEVERAGWLRTLGWLAAAHALPFLATCWWVNFSDSVKMLNPSGEALTSFNLAGWNFGVGQRFSAAIWSAHWKIYFRELIHPVVGMIALAGASLTGGRWLLRSAFCVGIFLIVQLIFPALYAWHEYYYVACGFALALAVGLILAGLLQSTKISRGIVFGAIILAYGSQMAGWYRIHYEEQSVSGAAGNGLTDMIKFVTEPTEAIVVAGDDWNSITPFYAERRALMLRDDVVRSPATFDAALEHMQGTPVAMLILRHNSRDDRSLVERFATQFEIDSRPALFWQGDRIYLSRQKRTGALSALKGRGINRFVGVTFAPEPTALDQPLANRRLPYSQLSAGYQRVFSNMHPAPTSFFSSVGPELWSEEGEQRFFAHPKTELWFSLAPGRYRFRTNITMARNSYTGIPRGDATDGVFLIATVVDTQGARHEAGRRHVNPRDHAEDRSVLEIDWPFSIGEGGQLEVEVTAGPAGSSARDWATLGAIKIDSEKAGS